MEALSKTNLLDKAEGASHNKDDRDPNGGNGHDHKHKSDSDNGENLPHDRPQAHQFSMEQADHFGGAWHGVIVDSSYSALCNILPVIIF